MGLFQPLDPYEWQPVTPRRRVRGWLAIVVSAALFAGLCAVALARGQSAGPVPPNQAGYQWCCEASEVSATWVVPRILQGASGSEGVWVGLQTDSGTFFLQVGTNEFVVDTHPLVPEYQAFWSDGPLHGSPQQLGELNAGDLVRAELKQAATGWSVSFSDRTQHWTHTTTVRHLAPSGGDLAEWVEEDPVLVFASTQERLDTMARTVPAAMSGLTVNGTAPATDALAGESFSADGRTFSPTSLVANRFSFVPW